MQSLCVRDLRSEVSSLKRGIEAYTVTLSNARVASTHLQAAVGSFPRTIVQSMNAQLDELKISLAAIANGALSQVRARSNEVGQAVADRSRHSAPPSGGPPSSSW